MLKKLLLVAHRVLSKACSLARSSAIPSPTYFSYLSVLAGVKMYGIFVPPQVVFATKCFTSVVTSREECDVTLRRGHAEYKWGQGSMLGHCVTSGVLLNMHNVRGQCLVIMWRQRLLWICMRSEFQICMRWKRGECNSRHDWRNLWRNWRNCDAFDAIRDAFDAIRDAFDVIRRSSWRNWRN